MKKDLTELVFILDRSGSMSGLEDETIGGFNSLIEKQKKEKGDALVSVVLFDHVNEVIYDRVPVEKVKTMTREEYYPRGCTALLDAVGMAIHHIGNVHKYVPDEMRPEKTLFVITTDGLENASREYTYSKVKKMISLEQEKYNWEFLFLGANIDAADEAESFGISRNHAVDYCADAAGTALNYEVLSDTIAEYRCGNKIKSNWKSRIDKDYEKRHK